MFRIRLAVAALAVGGSLVAAPAQAASVGPTGQFDGTTTVHHCTGALSSYHCSIDGGSTLCVEYAVLGVPGSPCTVTWTGGVTGAGSTTTGRTTCVAVGGGSAKVTSPSFPSGQTFVGQFTIQNTSGTFQGSDTDGVTPDGSTITLAFTVGCDQNLLNGHTEGSYQVLSVV